MKTFYAVLYCIIYPFFNLFHPCKAIGRENVPEGAAILCPNHTRLSDPLFVVYALGLKTRPRVMAKAEFMSLPVIGWLLKKAGVFAVDRGKSDVGAIKTAMKCLKGGDKLLMFPEGTRDQGGGQDQMGEGKAGVAMLAVRTGAALVPVYIPAKKKWFRRTPVVFGEAYIPKVEGHKGSSEEYKVIAKDLMEHIAALEGAAK